MDQIEIKKRACGVRFENHDREVFDPITGGIFSIETLYSTCTIFDGHGYPLHVIAIRSPWMFKQSFINKLAEYDWWGVSK